MMTHFGSRIIRSFIGFRWLIMLQTSIYILFYLLNQPDFNMYIFNSSPSHSKPAQPDSSSDILFGFPAKSPAIKQEPETQRPQRKRIATSDFKNSSSVFALPTQTDEIVIVEDSQPMFTSPDIKFEPECEDSADDNRRTVRTEYRQPIAVRTIKEKAAQPGFACPDCAPVSIFCKHMCIYFTFVWMIFPNVYLDLNKNKNLYLQNYPCFV